MNDILKKLNLKHINNRKLIINAPIDYIQILLNDHVNFDTVAKEQSYDFIQIFGLNNQEIQEKAFQVMSLLIEDGLIWLCYPKKSSKKYQGSDCDRDKVASLLASINFEPVRQVAIDEDFSALRFRHVSNIKTMVRKSAETEEGKQRIASNKNNE